MTIDCTILSLEMHSACLQILRKAQNDEAKR